MTCKTSTEKKSKAVGTIVEKNLGSIFSVICRISNTTGVKIIKHDIWIFFQNNDDEFTIFFRVRSDDKNWIAFIRQPIERKSDREVG